MSTQKVTIIPTIGLIIALIVGCGDNSPTGPPSPETGALAVTTTTSGPDSEDYDNGYTISVAGKSQSIDASGTAVITGLEEGNYNADLSGVLETCSVESENPQTVSISVGDTASVTFEIECEDVVTLEGEIVYTKKVSHENEISYDLHFMNPDGSEESSIRDTPDINEYYPDLSPDGTQIVYIIVDTTTTFLFGDIALMSSNGTGVERLTNEGWDSHPRWSPDGSKIVFQRERNDNVDIYVMNADGTGLQRLTNNAAADVYPEWSPDGSQIYFTSGRDGDSEIYVMNRNGTGITQLTHNSAFDTDAIPSPDGTMVAFTSNRDGTDNLYVMNADGSNIEQVTPFTSLTARHPTWSPDGSHISFCNDIDGPGLFSDNSIIYTIAADGGELKELTKAYSSLHPSWDARE